MAAANRFNFTKARLDGVPHPEKGHLDNWDEDVSGLMCRFTKTGGAFYLSKWADGAQRWIRIGSHPETTVREARAQALEKLAAINRGTRPWEDRATLKAEATLSELWDHFASHHAAAHKKASSRASDESIWRTVLQPWAGHKRIGSITRAEVQRLITKKGKDAPIRANRTLALLSAMFNRATADGLRKGENPAEGVQRFKERSRDRFLHQEELRALFASLGHEDEAWGLYFRASILCGARRSNMLSMRWSDLDLDRGLWRVPGEESKNGEPLLVILTADLVRALADWRTRCGSPRWVFPSADSASGHKIEPAAAWKRTLIRAECFRLLGLLAKAEGWDTVREAREREGALIEVGRMRYLAMGRQVKVQGDPWEATLASMLERVQAANLDASGPGITDVRLHDCRRTLGSWAAMSGSSTVVIGRALGHRSQQATAIYARLDLDPVRAAIETAGAAILEAAGEVP